MKMVAKFQAAPQKCDFYIQPGLLSSCGKIIQSLKPSQIFVVTNPRIRRLYFEDLRRSLCQAGCGRITIISIPEGEVHKDLKYLMTCYHKLILHDADRLSLIITLGGGVISDLGGMAAATYMRGIKLAHIPTTLVAQVDASIGGKTAVNHERSKNIFGSFYQADCVILDPLVLTTLSRREYLSGLVEIIKISLISNPRLFKYLCKNISRLKRRNSIGLRNIIQEALELKLNIVTQDPNDFGLRKMLNFGHTLGHALETITRYGRYSHGEAVALGILVSLKLGRNNSTFAQVQKLFNQIDLPTKIRRVSPKTLWKFMRLDKKSGFGRVNFVLLRGIGKPYVKNVSFQDFKRALEVIL